MHKNKEQHYSLQKTGTSPTTLRKSLLAANDECKQDSDNNLNKSSDVNKLGIYNTVIIHGNCKRKM